MSLNLVMNTKYKNKPGYSATKTLPKLDPPTSMLVYTALVSRITLPISLNIINDVDATNKHCKTTRNKKLQK